MSDKKYALFPFADSVFYGVVQRASSSRYYVKIGFKPETVPNETIIKRKDMIKLFNTVEECWLTYCKIETMYKNIEKIEQEIENTIMDLRNEK